MLDKSVPYADILMHRKPNTPVPDVILPVGYSLVHFQAGDEAAWAEIEASVLEFETPAAALEYFKAQFLPFLPELERRCLFIQDPHGEKVATATAWWSYSGKRRDPWIHWVAVKPKVQGLGLGKAIVSAVLRLMLEIEGDRDIYLHTQTWSHPAVRLYQKLGFFITSQPNLYKYSNQDYEKALVILESLELNGR